MSSINGKRYVPSARFEHVNGCCGHDKLVDIPAGNLGPVGRRRITQAAATPCRACIVSAPEAGVHPYDPRS